MIIFQDLDHKSSNYDLKLRLYEHWLDVYKTSGGTDFHSSRQRFFFSLCEFSYFFFGCIYIHGQVYTCFWIYCRNPYKLSCPPLSKDFFYGIRIEYFINIFLFIFFLRFIFHKHICKCKFK